MDTELPPGQPMHFYAFEEAIYEVYLHEPPSGEPAAPEALIQDLWRMQQFDRSALRTAAGEPLTVLDTGAFNQDGGPDFRNARLRIGGQVWCGDVEIHTCSNGWTAHNHHLDTRYNSVVLHVVLQADLTTNSLRRQDGTAIPELVLAPYLTASLRGLIHAFHTRPPGTIPCGKGWRRAPADIRHELIEDLALERLREKSARLASAFLLRPDLEELLYELVMTGLGYAKNAEAMLNLGSRIPLRLARSIADPLDLEALFLGVAGLLPEPAGLLQADRSTSDYAVGLRDRYARLNARLNVPPMQRESWQFFRLRPANFPPLRIAQAAALIAPTGFLSRDPLGQITAALAGHDPARAVRRLLAAEPGPFWQTHVRLDKTSKPHAAAIGAARADELIINAVLPVAILHAEHSADPALETAVIDVLRLLPPEKDEVVRRFGGLGTRPRDALQSQGLHQLYRTRCRQAHCLTCPVGRHLLSEKS
ncbi:MAG TPA: DUF2851 family protein [Rhodothermales bacterium]|nr:DUF2851 family protein [Rhodothermales bacterium]